MPVNNSRSMICLLHHLLWNSPSLQHQWPSLPIFNHLCIFRDRHTDTIWTRVHVIIIPSKLFNGCSHKLEYWSACISLSPFSSSSILRDNVHRTIIAFLLSIWFGINRSKTSNPDQEWKEFISRLAIFVYIGRVISSIGWPYPRIQPGTHAQYVLAGIILLSVPDNLNKLHMTLTGITIMQDTRPSIIAYFTTMMTELCIYKLTEKPTSVRTWTKIKERKILLLVDVPVCQMIKEPSEADSW